MSESFIYKRTIFGLFHGTFIFAIGWVVAQFFLLAMHFGDDFNSRIINTIAYLLISAIPLTLTYAAFRDSKKDEEFKKGIKISLIFGVVFILYIIYMIINGIYLDFFK